MAMFMNGTVHFSALEMEPPHCRPPRAARPCISPLREVKEDWDGGSTEGDSPSGIMWVPRIARRAHGATGSSLACRTTKSVPQDESAALAYSERDVEPVSHRSGTVATLGFGLLERVLD